jgi:hypothetical protein
MPKKDQPLFSGFTADDVENVRRALPKDCPAKKAELLPIILKLWDFLDLQIYFAPKPPGDKVQRRRLNAVVKEATKLLGTLSALSNDDLLQLSLMMSRWPEAGTWPPDRSETAKKERRLKNLKRLLDDFAAVSPVRPNSRGQPRHPTALRVLLDTQAVFEFMTGKAATRARRDVAGLKEGAEYGPFWDFAKAVWVAIYRTPVGLQSQIKNWAKASRDDRNRSPLLANINMLKPELGLFK